MSKLSPAQQRNERPKCETCGTPKSHGRTLDEDGNLCEWYYECDCDHQKVADGMIEEDVFVKIPPKKKYKIEVNVKSIKRGQPRLTEEGKKA